MRNMIESPRRGGLLLLAGAGRGRRGRRRLFSLRLLHGRGGGSSVRGEDGGEPVVVAAHHVAVVARARDVQHRPASALLPVHAHASFLQARRICNKHSLAGRKDPLVGRL